MSGASDKDREGEGRARAGHEQAGIDPKLLEILVCPLTKTTLRYDANAQELISKAAGLAFPIRSGVPLMTVEAARTLEDPPPGQREPLTKG